MRRWAVVAAVIGLAAAAGALLVVAANQDEDGPTVVEAAAAVDAGDYAETISTRCAEVATAAATGYDEGSAAGAEALDEVAAGLAAVPPPEARAAMAQALVDGVADYADLFRVRDDNAEAFSQRQNELTVVIEVRAAGLGADCGEGELVLSPPEPADPDDLAAVDDPDAAAGADACFAGDLAACDDLADGDPALVFYGVTCGGRLLHEEADDRYSCVATFAGPRPVGRQP